MRRPLPAFLPVLFLCVSLFAHAQQTGIINRAATSAGGRAVLDPNGDGYTSVTAAGFGGNDVSNSEITFLAVPSFSIEPFGDLRRGPNHLYSDFVPDHTNNGVYMHYTGSNLLFRFRMGSVMSGSKGYSILMDTDGRFGSGGAHADPNYIAATTGTNGNPGFEIEIVLETNSRIAIYNVDGSSTPVLVKAYSNWQDMSQVSVAGTFDNGDPDFLIDFYIPFADLQAAPFLLTAGSSLRFAATTVMSPQAAIGGPKSDIYGLPDEGYANTNTQYEEYIKAQPPVQLNGSGFGSMCTEAPVLNGPIGVGTVAVTGTWTKSTLSGAAGTASITVYRNGVAAGTVTGVASGTAWMLNDVVVSNGDVITAKAQAAGESMCLSSASVKAASCTPSNRPSLPVLTCANNYGKGVSGNNLASGWTVYVENLTRGTVETNLSAPAQFTSSGTSPNITWNYAGGCNGGPNMPSGTYKVYYMNASGCVSEPVYFCLATGTGSSNNLAGTAATPVILTPLTPGTTALSGTGEANSAVSLSVNGTTVQTVTASSTGSFQFSNLSLANGDNVQVMNVLNTGTVSTSKCIASSVVYAVSCISQPPILATDGNGELAGGAAITGYAGAAAGSTVRVYTSAHVLVATTTVQAGGSWSSAHAATMPAPFVAAAGTTYYATVQNGSCTVSAAAAQALAVTGTANTRCGSITGPVAAGASSISGTLSGAFTTTTVTLYLDGVAIGNTTTNTTAWGPLAVNTGMGNTLYPNGVLTIGIRETGKGEVSCPASAVTIACAAPPAAPVVTPASFSTVQNQSVTYTITNAVAGQFYGIADAATGRSLATGAWATSNGSLSISTNAFAAAGTYNVIVKATSLSGLTVCTSTPAMATVAVSSILPVRFVSISAGREAAGNRVRWMVAGEENVSHYVVERSLDGNRYEAAGRVNYTPASSPINAYAFLDAVTPAGKIYYRIREVDTDGRVHYSPVAVLRTEGEAVARLFPNPATSTAAVYIFSEKEEKLQLSVFDAGGRDIHRQSVSLQRGANTVPVTIVPVLAKGTYSVRLATAGWLQHHQLVIQ